MCLLSNFTPRSSSPPVLPFTLSTASEDDDEIRIAKALVTLDGAFRRERKIRGLFPDLP